MKQTTRGDWETFVTKLVLGDDADCDDDDGEEEGRMVIQQYYR
jgi:hypothetical protein